MELGVSVNCVSDECKSRTGATLTTQRHSQNLRRNKQWRMQGEGG